MATLDLEGLTYFKGKLDPNLVRGMTAAEYDALTDEQKKGAIVITDEDDDSIAIDQNVYAKNEVRIGTYLGKPLYRKMVDFTTPSVNTSYVTIYEESGIFLKWVYGYYIHGGRKVPMHWVAGSSSYTNYCWDDTIVKMNINGTTYQNLPGVLTIEYTKEATE